MKRFGAIAVFAMALMAAARTANAQSIGIPYMPVETGTGIFLSADYADQDIGTAYGISGGVGLGRFGIMASVGTLDAGATLGDVTSYGARVGMRLFGGGLSPIAVGAQLGAISTQDISPTGGSQTMILPAAFVRAGLPLFPVKGFGQVYYVTGSDLASSQEEVRFTIGANLNLLLGFGLHAAYDWGDSSDGWGIGAHFTFKLPGVPVVPGV